MSFWMCGSQATEMYSNDERIKARYVVFLQFSGQCFRFLRRKPRVELAFREILYMDFPEPVVICFYPVRRICC